MESSSHLFPILQLLDIIHALPHFNWLWWTWWPSMNRHPQLLLFLLCYFCYFFLIFVTCSLYKWWLFMSVSLSSVQKKVCHAANYLHKWSLAVEYSVPYRFSAFFSSHAPVGRLQLPLVSLYPSHLWVTFSCVAVFLHLNLRTSSRVLMTFF